MMTNRQFVRALTRAKNGLVEARIELTQARHLGYGIKPEEFSDYVRRLGMAAELAKLAEADLDLSEHLLENQ